MDFLRVVAWQEMGWGPMCLAQNIQRPLDRAPPARRIAGKPAPTFVATCRSSRAMVARLGAWPKTGGAAAAPAEKSRRADKADNYGVSGHGTLQQM